MSRPSVLRRFSLVLMIGVIMPAWSWAQCGPQGCAPASVSGQGNCQSCQWLHCPPPYRHCQEKPPCILWHCGCPHPICNPCDLPHWGHYETCWYPWPFPATQCIPPSPASLVTLNPFANPNVPMPDPRQQQRMNTNAPPMVMPAPQPLPSIPTPIPDDLPPPRTLRP